MFIMRVLTSWSASAASLDKLIHQISLELLDPRMTVTAAGQHISIHGLQCHPVCLIVFCSYRFQNSVNCKEKSAENPQRARGVKRIYSFDGINCCYVQKTQRERIHQKFERTEENQTNLLLHFFFCIIHRHSKNLKYLPRNVRYFTYIQFV